MQSSRITELLDPFLGPPGGRRLTPDAVRRISMYIDLLQRWNARVNLTAIRNEQEVVTRHFGESLFAAHNLFPKNKNETGVPHVSPHLREAGTPTIGSGGTTGRPRLADVGAGAGFPGIPIKLWVPEISLTLIESNQKKATFLREVTRALTLTDVDVKNARAESLSDIKFAVVTLRAVERFESILPVAAGLVAKGGRLALLIGKSQLTQAHSSLSNLNWSPPIPIPDSKSRLLAIAMNP